MEIYSVFFPDLNLFIFLYSHCSRCWCGAALPDRWSYSPFFLFTAQSCSLFCHRWCKFEAGGAVMDGLMTGLCESFNPFMKLSRGALEARYSTTSPHLASKGQCEKFERLYRSWRFSTSALTIVGLSNGTWELVSPAVTEREAAFFNNNLNFYFT